MKPNKRHLKAVALTLLIHLGFLAMLLGSGSGSGSPSQSSSGTNGNVLKTDLIVPPPSKNEPTEISDVKLPTPKKKPKTPHSDEKCENWFGGIGIEIGVGTSVDTGLPVYFIATAPMGYPAYLAGIRPNDELMTQPGTIQGPVGTEVEVSFKNGTGLHTVKLVRDKICTEGNSVQDYIGTKMP